MFRYYCVIVLCIAAFCTANAQNLDPNYIDGEVYIKLKDTHKLARANSAQVNVQSELPFLSSLNTTFSFTAQRSFFFAESPKLQRTYRLTMTQPKQIEAFINALQQQADIEYVEKVPLYQKILTPNDPSVGTQYHLSTIQAYQAWDVTTGIDNIIVAVVDDAVQTTHPDLAANCVAGRDVADNDNDPNPPTASFSHGTHVAGIVGAVTNNGVGIASVGYNKVKIMGVKATGNSQNPSYIYYGEEGVAWAAQNGAKVINMSWGGTGSSQTGQNVMNNAAALGVVLVAAAGNSNNTTALYPAAYNHVIAVASTDSQDKKSGFSSFGTYVDISAPGSGIYSTVPFGSYATYSGTSMASPLTASLCGFILSNNNTLSPAQVEQILKNTADNIDTQNPTFVGQLGAGRINVFKAVGCSFSATVSLSGSSLICPNETRLITANVVGNGPFNYQWKNGNNNVGTNSLTYTAPDSGSFSVVVSKVGCNVSSPSIVIGRNTRTLPLVSVVNRTICAGTPLTAGIGLQATPAACAAGGASTFTYAGPTVGYDNYTSSGPDPTITANGLGGTITSVSVSITWEKKHQSGVNSCDSLHITGSPWNDEISFRLRSPDGTIVNLLNADTYGGSYAGVVTTVFQAGGTVITTGSTPASGTFAPAQALSAYNGKIASGVWTLLPADDGLIDPLCVQGFSVSLTTTATGGTPTLTWWSAAQGDTLLQTGGQYLPTPTAPNTYIYYAQAQCTNICPNTRTAVTLTIQPISAPSPAILAFPLVAGSPAFQTATQIIGQPAGTTFDTTTYQLQNSVSNQHIVVSTKAPLVAPITICPSESVLLIATKCAGMVAWSNDTTKTAIIVTPNNTSTYTATCRTTGACASAASLPVVVRLNATALTVTSVIPPNALQTFRAVSLTAQNTVSNTATLQYIGGQEVVLLPGFMTSNGAVFKAEIGNCPPLLNNSSAK